MGGTIPMELKLKHPKIFGTNLNISNNLKCEKKKQEANNIVIEEPKDASIIYTQEGSREIIAPFTMPDYIFDFDGTPRHRNSSVNDQQKISISGTGLANIIMNNPVIKEVVPDMKPDDIYLQSHMLLMKVKRGDSEEIYRIDILGNDILVMAPTEATFKDIESGQEYNFISVSVSTDLGRKILTTSDYKVKATDDWNDCETIFRINQNAI